eukprot:NODE_4257_length_1091_cov_52.832645_g4058_i0.p1 GENE.NODE_4257_length_1091_cov_52.832645_g4058_i0~~NODE_4257_length_1091_cov_52.832645_g4058_i0.p1  ORF type:complete len:139 (+),score=6.41 NODE_4257_length_1091_cov_52.832645_g4058_i0:266-682(+)
MSAVHQERTGAVQFLGQLFLQGVVNDTEVRLVLDNLLAKANQFSEFLEATLSLELACALTSIVGTMLDARRPGCVQKYLLSFQAISRRHSTCLHVAAPTSCNDSSMAAQQKHAPATQQQQGAPTHVHYPYQHNPYGAH